MNRPRFSILLAVHDGAVALDRAIGSVVVQTCPDWELLVVASDATPHAAAVLQKWSAADQRIHAFSLPEDRSTGAALNRAAAEARGEFIGYLEVGAEFAPVFLECVAAFPERFDVLVCGYDFVIGRHEASITVSETGMAVQSGSAPNLVAWDPAQVRTRLFVCNIARRLGVVHRRDLFERAGGFNELLWEGEEWELWKRFARLGAAFVFSKIKAGRYRVQVDGSNSDVADPEAASRALNGDKERRRLGDKEKDGALLPTEWQMGRIEQNRWERKPAFGTRSGWMRPKRVERILFVCVQCVLDYSNGASLAVLHTLRWLNANGFAASAFCLCEHGDPERDHALALGLESAARPVSADPARGEGRSEVCETVLRDGFGQPPGTLASSATALGGEPDLPLVWKRPLPDGRGSGGQADKDVWQTIAAGIPVTIRQVARNDPWRVTGDTRKFLDVYERLLNEQRPDVVVTYGGDCLSLAMMEATRFRDIPVVFWLHNFAYPDRLSFQFVDRVIVPSDFSRDYHWKSLGLDCCAIPNFIDWPRVQVQGRKPRYVTFVNPAPYKGVFVFVAIAARLAAIRPDISLLVVEGRTSPALLHSIGIDLTRFPNVRVIETTADPREFYSVTKLLLIPSLWNESFGLVAVEAMINGIPVLASNRGALPEIVGNGGDLFDIPAPYTPVTRVIPTADEIQPWVDRIIELWDDPVACVEAGRRAHGRAQTWRPDRIGPLYQEFFSNVSPQPAPPIVNSQRARREF